VPPNKCDLESFARSMGYDVEEYIKNKSVLRIAHFVFCDMKKTHLESLEELVEEKLHLLEWKKMPEYSVKEKKRRLHVYRKTYIEQELEIKIEYVVTKFADLDIPSLGQRPMMSFVDPYGFSVIPMSQVKQLIGTTKCCVTNLMVSYVNRFKKVHPKHISDLFGEEQEFEFKDSMTATEKLNIISKKYIERLKEETEGLATSTSCAMRKGVSSPTCDTIYSLVISTGSHSTLQNIKSSMVQHVQDASGKGELAISDFYVRHGIEVPYGRVTSDEDEAEIIYDLLHGKTMLLGNLKAFVLEETNFPYHTRALTFLEKDKRLTVTPMSWDGTRAPRSRKSLCFEVSHSPEIETEKFGNYWKIEFAARPVPEQDDEERT
jgi:hypothetical protein